MPKGIPANGMPRLTPPTKAVLRVLVGNPDQEMYCREIGRATGLNSGTVALMLIRLEDRGWLVSRWEGSAHRSAGRPERRYYRLTNEGAVHAKAVTR